MFLKRLFKFIPKNEFSRALRLYNSGNYSKALKKFEELQAVSERHEDVDRSTLDLYTCEAHVALAKAHIAADEIEQAIGEMEKAISIKPTFADLRYLLGTLYSRRCDFDEAQEQFAEALAINNKFFRARVYLSLALRATGSPEEAIAEVAKSHLSCPNFYREPLDHLEMALRSGEENDEVERLYRVLLEERPSSAQISREMAIEAIQNGDCEEAIRELKKAIALNPDYPDLHNYLGIAYGNGGMVDDAVEEFEVALKINPYYLKARLNLALLYYENDCYEEAHAQLAQVLKVQPDNQLANNLRDELQIVSEET